VSPHGLFALDTRFLSRWRLTLDGQSPVLSTDTQRYYGAQFFLAPSTGTTYVDSPLSLVRRRWIDQGMKEDVAIVNHTPEPKAVHLHLDLDADFADLFEVKDALTKKGRLYKRVEDNSLLLGYARDDYKRETRVTVEAEKPHLSEDAIDFDIDLPAHGAWFGKFHVQPFAEGFTPQDGVAPRSQDEMETLRPLAGRDTSSEE
jgi:glycogen debranching enzyme